MRAVLREELADMRTTVSEINTRMVKFESIIEKQAELEARIRKVETHSELQEAQIIILKKTVNALEQEKLACKIIVNGLPEVETNNEELKAVTNGLCSQLGVDIGQNFNVIRLGPAKEKSIRPIEIKLVDQEMRSSIISAKRLKKIDCSMIQKGNKPIGPATQKIYFDEKLSQYNAYLYYILRGLKRKNLIRYAWVNNGQVFARVSEGSPRGKISHEEDTFNFLFDNNLENQCSNILAEMPPKRKNAAPRLVGVFEALNARLLKRRAEDQADPGPSKRI